MGRALGLIDLSLASLLDTDVFCNIMASGIEVAGLVLGALPLIISGEQDVSFAVPDIETDVFCDPALEHYNDGLKPFKDFVNYKPLIQRLASDLQTQRTLLRLTCESLLIGIEIPQPQLDALLNDPKASTWGEESLVRLLETRLQESHFTFIKLLSKLAASIEGLAGKIGLNATGQPLPDYLGKRKRYWKRFRTCLSLEEHEALILRIRQDNEDLHRLIEVSLQLETYRSYRRIQKGSYKRIRDCADCLHSALRSCWSCSCSDPHCAELRLEQRDWEQPPCFRVTFPVAITSSQGTPSTWHETEIKAIQRPTPTGSTVTEGKSAHCNTLTNAQRKPESTPTVASIPKSPNATAFRSQISTSIVGLRHKDKKTVAWAVADFGVQATNLHLADLKATQGQSAVEEEVDSIDDLCSILRCRGQTSSKAVLGRFMHGQSQYEMVSISQENAADNAPSTFHDLLLSHEAGVPPIGSTGSPINTWVSRRSTGLTKKARLKLAVTLASTALQLCTTPWLDGDWTGRNIYFRSGSVDRPYISRAFVKPETYTAKPFKPNWSPIRNRDLFALGVLLLEISLKKPLEHFKGSNQEQRSQHQNPDCDDYLTACQLFQDLGNEEGTSSGYYDATQACILCNFGPKVKDLDLANDTFRRAVYEDVILPLERDLEYFCKGP